MLAYSGGEGAGLKQEGVISRMGMELLDLEETGAEKKDADLECSVDSDRKLNRAAVYILRDCDNELDLESEIKSGNVPAA